MAPVFFCTHLFGVQVELYSLSSACVLGWGAGRKGGQKEEWRDGGGWRDGGLSVISPEGDNGRGAHCNGCHVVPSLHN